MVHAECTVVYRNERRMQIKQRPVTSIRVDCCHERLTEWYLNGPLGVDDRAVFVGRFLDVIERLLVKVPGTLVWSSA